ncbi:unnamed protein product [Schistosoma bovis]|nr:unnamed protein product [Schistosoma bovis]CAH8591980.1 unnamed protein product [Schistosoma bovis]
MSLAIRDDGCLSSILSGSFDSICFSSHLGTRSHTLISRSRLLLLMFVCDHKHI